MVSSLLPRFPERRARGILEEPTDVALNRWRMTDSFQISLVPGAKSSESGEPSWWQPVEEVFYQP